MILTMAKYHEILLRDSTLSLLLIEIFFLPWMIQKTPNETFLKITQCLILNSISPLFPPKRTPPTSSHAHFIFRAGDEERIRPQRSSREIRL